MPSCGLDARPNRSIKAGRLVPAGGVRFPLETSCPRLSSCPILRFPTAGLAWMRLVSTASRTVDGHLGPYWFDQAAPLRPSTVIRPPQIGLFPDHSHDQQIGPAIIGIRNGIRKSAKRMATVCHGRVYRCRHQAVSAAKRRLPRQGGHSPAYDAPPTATASTMRCGAQATRDSLPVPRVPTPRRCKEAARSACTAGSGRVDADSSSHPEPGTPPTRSRQQRLSPGHPPRHLRRDTGDRDMQMRQRIQIRTTAVRPCAIRCPRCRADTNPASKIASAQIRSASKSQENRSDRTGGENGRPVQALLSAVKPP